MYILKQNTKELLEKYKKIHLVNTTGISYYTLQKLIEEDEPVIKKSAYCITKYLDCNKEIDDYFIRKEN